MKNQNTDDIKLKPGETITDETLDELTGGKGDDNEEQPSGGLHQAQPEPLGLAHQDDLHRHDPLCGRQLLRRNLRQPVR